MICAARLRACERVTTLWRHRPASAGAAQRGLLRKQQLRFHSDVADEDKYLELKQLRDIKRCVAFHIMLAINQLFINTLCICVFADDSEEFYDRHGQERRYFYYIDLQVR